MSNSSSRIILEELQNERKDILEMLREPFLKYCEEIAMQLDNRTGEVSKYYQVNPEIDKESLAIDSKKRENFIHNTKEKSGDKTFDDFYSQLQAVLPRLQLSDMETLGQTNETLATKDFRKCFDMLNDAGFYNVNRNPVNFWSGSDAQKQANTTNTSLSDSNVPAINIMIKFGVMLLENKSPMAELLFHGSSAELSAEATGTVMLFMPKTMTAHNFNWLAELNRLQGDRHTGKISELKISILDPVHKAWSEPMHFQDVLTQDRVGVMSRSTSLSDNQKKTPVRPSTLRRFKSNTLKSNRESDMLPRSHSDATDGSAFSREESTEPKQSTEPKSRGFGRK